MDPSRDRTTILSGFTAMSPRRPLALDHVLVWISVTGQPKSLAVAVLLVGGCQGASISCWLPERGRVESRRMLDSLGSSVQLAQNKGQVGETLRKSSAVEEETHSRPGVHMALSCALSATRTRRTKSSPRSSPPRESYASSHEPNTLSSPQIRTAELEGVYLAPSLQPAGTDLWTTPPEEQGKGMGTSRRMALGQLRFWYDDDHK